MTQQTASNEAVTGPPGVDETAITSRNNVALVLLLAATFVVFLNETAMSVAVPNILDDLHLEPSAGQWLTTAFALTMAVVIPITGFLLQRVTTRMAFVLAMSLFISGTLLAAVAPGFEVLVIGRVLQGSGTAIMMPLLMTTVLTLVPMSSRGRMMGRISIVMSVAPAIGPAISGLILFVLPWRGLFWVMLPIAAVMLLIGILRVPNVSETRKVPLDVLSVVLSAIGFSGVVYGLSTLGGSTEGALFPVWLPLVIGGVFLAAFILRQFQLQRRDAAFLDLRSFSSGVFTASIVMLAISMLALFGTFFVLPIYIHSVLGQEPLVIGLLLLPGGLIMGVLGPLVGRLYDRFGPKPLVIPGSIVITLTLVGFSFLSANTPLYVVLALHIALSLGLAFLFTPLFTAGTGALPPHLYSHGSATIATIQQVAGAAGVAIFVALLTAGVTAAGGDSYATASPAQLTDGIRLAFLGGAIASVGAIVVAFFVRKPVEQPGGHGEWEQAAEH